MDHLIGAFEITFLYLSNKSRNIDRHRAFRNAWLIPAIQAALRLTYCLIFCIAQRNLVKFERRISDPERAFHSFSSTYSAWQFPPLSILE